MNSFTHVDPFEDTESAEELPQLVQHLEKVSPTSIRSRILKARGGGLGGGVRLGFTHVDPFEDTESDHSGGGKEAEGMKFHPRRSVRGY